MKDERFNFFVPIDEIEKSGSDSNDPKRYKNMYLQGCASTNDIDTDEEILEPDGFNLEVFKQKGMINYEHQAKKSPKAFIGEPVMAEIKNNKLFVKAKLWEKHPLAKDLWDTLHIMKESGSDRKLAWSIEGVPMMKDPHNPKRIMKALITHMALTFMPKNGKTFAEICKGLGSEEKLDYDIPTDIDYLFKGIYGENEYTLHKDFTITKAMSAGSETGQQLVGKLTSGAALKAESLDPDLKILTIPIDTVHWVADSWDNFKKDTKKAIQKAFHSMMEKARSGVYEDNEKNRELGRVGQKYAGERGTTTSALYERHEKEKKEGKLSMFDLAAKIYDKLDYKDIQNERKIASALKELGYPNHAMMVGVVKRKIKEVIDKKD